MASTKLICFNVIFVLHLLILVDAAIDKAVQYEAWDANKDNKWSRAEAEYVLYEKNMADILKGKGFEAIDKNDDGGISKSEYDGSPLKTFLERIGTPSKFEDVDPDKSALILPLEFVKAVETATKKQMDDFFPAADVNKDGFLSLEEFSNSDNLVKSVCEYPCSEADP